MSDTKPIQTLRSGDLGYLDRLFFPPRYVHLRPPVMLHVFAHRQGVFETIPRTGRLSVDCEVRARVIKSIRAAFRSDWSVFRGCLELESSVVSRTQGFSPRS